MSIEIIGRDGQRAKAINKQHRAYNSALTKQEIIDLINEEIKMYIDQQINLVDMIEQASFNVSTPNDGAQDNWESKAEEIRSELKKGLH